MLPTETCVTLHLRFWRAILSALAAMVAITHASTAETTSTSLVSSVVVVIDHLTVTDCSNINLRC